MHAAHFFNPKNLSLKLLTLAGWFTLAFCLAWASWAVITWLYPAQPYVAKTTSAPAAKALWATSLNNYFISQEEVAEEISPTQEVEKSRLPISVQGVLFSNLTNRSVVLLKYKNKFLTLVEGDELDTNILLVKITNQALIFNNRGQLEEVSLQLEGETLNLFETETASEDKKPATSSTSTISREPVSEERLGTRALEDTFGADFKENLLKDPLQLMSYITLIPVNEEGKLKGFRLQPGVKPELFNHFELEANDLLLAVDGIEVSNTQQMMQLTSKLAEATSVSLDIQRGEEVIRKYLDME